MVRVHRRVKIFLGLGAIGVAVLVSWFGAKNGMMSVLKAVAIFLVIPGPTHLAVLLLMVKWLRKQKTKTQ